MSGRQRGARNLLRNRRTQRLGGAPAQQFGRANPPGTRDDVLLALFALGESDLLGFEGSDFPKSVLVAFRRSEETDQRVERSLYMRAVGYSYDAVKIFMPAGAKAPIYAPYVEHVVPDVTACIFWLKNRDPAHWRDAWQVDHTLGKYIISDKPMTEEEWIRERATVIDGEAAEVIEDKTRAND